MTARASFREKYEAAAAANDSLLCVGLDPDPSRLPPGVDIDAWLREVIEATSDLVCCYKPNAAFFEARGPHGQEALWALIDGIPDEIPVLLDAKRGDVGHSAEFYARAVFEVLGADAVTVNPLPRRRRRRAVSRPRGSPHVRALPYLERRGRRAAGPRPRGERRKPAVVVRDTCTASHAAFARLPSARTPGTRAATSALSSARRTRRRRARSASCARTCCS